MAERARYRGLSFCYDVDSRALPRELTERFVSVGLDEENRAYIDAAIENRHGNARMRLRKLLLGYMSDFDANALLNMYPMHLLGTAQWKRLVDEQPSRRHLDVGAGSGDVTATLAPLSGELVTTETSWGMNRRLRQRGFQCVRTDIAQDGVPAPAYGLITCLNVIDRCPRPRTLLQRLIGALEPGGKLVVATPLPFDPFFYDGPRSLEPREPVRLPRLGWERSLTALVEDVFIPLGVEIEAVSRAPYLSGGDARQPLYVLDDAIIVCRKPGATSTPHRR